MTQFEIQKLLASDGDASDEFGRAVAVEGNTAVIGTFAGAGNSAASGSVYVFNRNEAGTWSETQKLFAADGADGDRFGRSVDLQGDTIVVGAFFDVINNTRTGSTYVFTRGENGIWGQQQKLTANDGQADDRFGHAVAVDGNTVVVSARSGDGNSANSGTVYVFVRTGDNWSQEQELVADDGLAGDQFGNSIAINGDIVIVGAPQTTDNGPDSGSAYVFERTDGPVWTQKKKLTAGDNTGGDRFGHFLAMDEDITIIAALFGDGLDADTGSVYLFSQSADGNWTETQELFASDGLAQDEFGHSIALDGDTILVGAFLANGVSDDAGAAYVFTRKMGVWTQASILNAADGIAGDRFGWSVSVSGDTAFVSAKQTADNGSRSGSAYVFSPVGAPVAQLEAIADQSTGSSDAGLLMWVKETTANEAHVFEGSSGDAIASMPFGTANFEMRATTAAGDVNLDGIDEISAVAVDDLGLIRAWVLDTATQIVLNTMTFPTLFAPIDLVSATASNTGQDRRALGLLGVDPTGASTLRFKDAASGTQTCDLVKFGRTFRSLGARVLGSPTGNNIQKVAIIGVNPKDTRVRVNIRDACNLADSVSIFYNKNFPPVDFQIVPDINGNDSDEIAVLGRKESGEVQVVIKDSVSKEVLGRYAFSANFVPIALVVINDTQPTIGVLGRRDDGATRVTLKRAVDGATAGTVNFQTRYLPRDIVVLDDSNGNDASELAVLGFDVSGTGHLEIRDSSTKEVLADRDVP